MSHPGKSRPPRSRPCYAFVNRYVLARRATLGAAIPVLSLVLASCEAQDPFDIGWIQSPDTALLYSIARPELNRPSAFDFHLGVARIVESPNSTGLWDVVLDTRDDQLVFLLPADLGIESEARVLELPGQSFDDVAEAPADTTAYSREGPVALALGSVYVVRTHVGRDQFGFNCMFFGKMEALEINVATGTLLFVHDTNPLCGDRDLIAPGRN